MEEFSLFPSAGFIHHLPAKTSTPCSAWKSTSFLPVYLIKTYNASLWRRHNTTQARGLPHMYDSNSWRLFLLHRRKKEWNSTSVTLAGPTRSELTPWHPKYSTFICSLLFKSECNSGHEGDPTLVSPKGMFYLKNTNPSSLAKHASGQQDWQDSC